jgi:hypothetical protein
MRPVHYSCILAVYFTCGVWDTSLDREKRYIFKYHITSWSIIIMHNMHENCSFLFHPIFLYIKRYINPPCCLVSLKWGERNFEIFSNIKLIVLKNPLCCPLYETTNEKILSSLVCPQKNRKFGDGDRCTIASYEKNTNDLPNFFLSKNFKHSVYNLLGEF